MKYNREFYQNLINKYNNTLYFEKDPVAVVRLLSNEKDIEVMGIVASWVAFGNRKQIFKKCNQLYQLMNGHPYDYLMSKQWIKYKECEKDNLYRMFVYSDYYTLMNCMYRIYTEFDSLQSAVIKNMGNSNDYIGALISLLPTKGIPINKNSACKRLCLFLRWMVRTDGVVDLGIWKNLSPENLIIPLDVHVHNTAKMLEFTNRKQADMNTALEITNECKALFPSDPVIMDYALFGAGYNENNK
ncbi:MAG: TIGR02757 family protein [Bacteroidales bacterium]|nr:TIGR02757 family protein [Bacteroidales bacterium]